MKHQSSVAREAWEGGEDYYKRQEEDGGNLHFGMKTHKKPYGYGAYTPEKIEAILSNNMLQQRGDGYYQPARPIPYYSFIERLVQAWHVLTYQADPLYWYFKKPYERTESGFKKID